MNIDVGFKKELWNSKDPHKYDSHNDIVLKGFLSQLDKKIVQFVYDARNVLEIGCGTGRFINSFRRSFVNKKIYGIDISLNMLKTAKNKNINNILCSTGENLPFKNNIFDAVVGCYYSFRWLDRKRAYKEINLVLKKDGLLVFDIPNYYTYIIEGFLKNLRSFNILSKIESRASYDSLNLKNFNQEIKSLKAAGFEVLSITSTPYLPFLRRFIDTSNIYYPEVLSKLGYDYIFAVKKVNDVD